MSEYVSAELRKDEKWVFNATSGKLPNREGKLKTMRFGKQALDIYGEKLDPNYILPVFIHKSELGLLDKLWGEELREIRRKR